MTEESTPYKMPDLSQFKTQSAVIVFLTAYMVLCGTISLVGFWHVFDVDPFDYIGPQDIVKYGIPYVAYYLTTIIIVVFQHFYVFKLHQYPIYTIAIKQKYINMYNNIKQIRAVVIFIFITGILAFVAEPYKFGIIALLVPGILSIALKNNTILSAIVPEINSRLLLIFFFFSLPLYILYNRNAEAHQIYDNKKYQLVLHNTGDMFEALAPDRAPLKYVGRLSDTVFVQTVAGNRLGIIKLRDGKVLALEPPGPH